MLFIIAGPSLQRDGAEGGGDAALRDIDTRSVEYPGTQRAHAPSRLRQTRRHRGYSSSRLQLYPQRSYGRSLLSQSCISLDSWLIRNVFRRKTKVPWRKVFAWLVVWSWGISRATPPTAGGWLDWKYICSHYHVVQSKLQANKASRTASVVVGVESTGERHRLGPVSGRADYHRRRRVRR